MASIYCRLVTTHVLTLEAIAADVQAGGGSTHLMLADEPRGAGFAALFDRSDEYAALLDEIREASDSLDAATALDVLKQARKLRKTFTALVGYRLLRRAKHRNRPTPRCKSLKSLRTARSRPMNRTRCAVRSSDYALQDFKQRVWATRRRPWVDRLACAWLIRRYIDRKARFVWLAKPKDCPAKAIGFDFDGATFSHVGARVTFEVMLASFGLEQPALRRIGAIVHYLDAGGVQPPEASGIESVLAGLRDSIDDDDQLVKAAGTVFDGLLMSFEKADLPE